jgi:hypothetical protein
MKSVWPADLKAATTFGLVVVELTVVCGGPGHVVRGKSVQLGIVVV